MTASANDPSLALAAVSQQDLIQRKQSLDALRERLGDNKSKEQALRESCEGFESIFLQKMWEQMRKNVPKEGYLHSKDEEMYQSLFDVELCKKMTSAGGIGLADMLYEQLSQQLVNTGRTTSPSTYRPPVIPPTTAAVLAASETVEKPAKVEPAPTLTVENLYTPIEDEVIVETPLEENPVTLALAEFAKMAEESPEISAIEPGRVGAGVLLPGDLPLVPSDADAKGNEPVKGENIQAASWQSLGRVSATPRPVSKFNRPLNVANTVSKGSSMPGTTATSDITPEQARSVGQAGVPELIVAQRAGEGAQENGILPDRAFWPVEGKIRTPFGWYEGADAQRNWNPGVFIDAREGDRVAACMGGKIIYNGEAEGFDNMVILEHGENYRSYYGNVIMHGLDIGDSVQGGMLFASVSPPDRGAADTAKSSAFYFGLKRGEMALNPELAVPRFLTAQR